MIYLHPSFTSDLFASSIWSRRLKKPVIYSLLGKIQQSYLALRLLPPAHDSNTIQRHRVTWKSFHRSSTRSENGWNSTSITREWRTGFCLLVQNNVKNICSHVSSSRDILLNTFLSQFYFSHVLHWEDLFLIFCIFFTLWFFFLLPHYSLLVTMLLCLVTPLLKLINNS